jgi:hypothetical protein
LIVIVVGCTEHVDRVDLASLLQHVGAGRPLCRSYTAGRHVLSILYAGRPISRVRSKIATERIGECVMSAQDVVWEWRALLTAWMSKKSMRLAVLLGALLTVSVAVNAVIILADGNRP